MEKEINKIVFACESNETGVTIIKVANAQGDVVIPREIDGLPVTRIGDWAFRDCTGLTNVTMRRFPWHMQMAWQIEDDGYTVCKQRDKWSQSKVRT